MVYAHLTLQTPESQAIANSFKQVYGGAIRFQQDRKEPVYRPPSDQGESELRTIQANSLWFLYRNNQFPRIRQIIDNHPQLTLRLSEIEDRKRRAWEIEYVSNRVRAVHVDLPIMLQACLDELEAALLAPPAQPAQQAQQARQTPWH